MSDHITLLGAEQVSDAARNMQTAAESMQRAANQFDQSSERLMRALEEHAARIEAVVSKDTQ